MIYETYPKKKHYARKTNEKMRFRSYGTTVYKKSTNVELILLDYKTYRELRGTSGSNSDNSSKGEKRELHVGNLEGFWIETKDVFKMVGLTDL